MKATNNEAGNVAMWAVVLVAGLVIGFAGGRLVGNDGKTIKDTAKVTASTKAADLRANLVTLGVQHMELVDHAVDAALDGSPNAKAVADSLYRNGKDIGAAVGSVYGADAEKTFDGVWKLHLDQFVNYAVASSKGDSAGKAAALKAIDEGYTKPLSQYLAKANPNLPEATLESVLSEHVTMTAKMIDDHTSGKYADEAAELNTADQHIAGIFSTLAEAIVKQYPNKF